MGNREILLSLNNETKKYFDDAFSYLDYFTQNEEIFDFDEEETFAFAFLLSTLKNDEVLKKVFEENHITFEEVCDHLGIKDENIKLNESEKTYYVQQNKLIQLFSNISSRIKHNNYLKNTNISLTELHPYQIFDFISDYYFDSLKDLLNDMGIDYAEEAIYDICKKAYDIDSDPNHNNSPEKKIYYSREFNFEECKIMLTNDEAYISFDRAFNFPGALISGEYRDRSNGEKINLKEKTDLLVCKDKYKITRISGYDSIDETVLDKLFNTDDMISKMTIHLTDVDDENKTFVMTLNTKKAFIQPLTNENQRVLNDALKMNDFYKEEHGGPMIDTPFLDNNGIDLTRIKYLKDPSVDRDEELKAIEKILLYPEKDTSIMIIGNAGCGKTALVKGLAYRIQRGKVPKALKNLRIVSINCSDLVADTRYVGTLEKKMKALIKEASSSKDIVLFLDAIHQAMGAGKSEGNNNTISEMLKNYIGLEEGGIRVIGATTTDEYYKYISVDPSFETRFKLFKIKEPDETTIYAILDNLIKSYNKFSDAKLLLEPEDRDALIKWLIASTADRYRYKDTLSSNPRLVLDITKNAYATAAMNDRTEVTYQDFMDAINAEDRLYPSCREEAMKRLEHLKPEQYRDNIISFKLIPKKVVK